MHAHAAVDGGAVQTQQHTKCDRRPRRVLGRTIETMLLAITAEHTGPHSAHTCLTDRQRQAKLTHIVLGRLRSHKFEHFCDRLRLQRFAADNHGRRHFCDGGEATHNSATANETQTNLSSLEGVCSRVATRRRDTLEVSEKLRAAHQTASDVLTLRCVTRFKKVGASK